MKNTKIDCENCANVSGSIFCQLEKAALGDVSKNKIMNTYKKGQTLFHEGNPPFGLFCINSGKIKLTKMSEEGKDSIVRIVSAGDVLGHRSLFSDGPYRATATAIEDAQVCFLDKKYIASVMNEQPSIALEIIAHLSKEMGAVENKVANFYQKNVRERLASLLLELNEKYGVDEEDGSRKLDIKLTRDEMASIVGVATETIIRFISEFKDEGAIEQRGKTIYIADIKKIRELGSVLS